MSSLNVSLTLNDRLAQASKKFTKACVQIKLIKQQISEYIGMFAYYGESSQFVASDLSVQQQLLYNNGHLFVRAHETNDDFNHNLARENLRQKIETLQNFKSIFFMYAHQKAEEITKLQCELYGEEAVREAYDMAPPEVLIPANTNDTNDSNNDSNDSLLNDIYNSNTNDETTNDDDWTNHFNETNDTNSNQSNNTAQLQLIEYSF